MANAEVTQDVFEAAYRAAQQILAGRVTKKAAEDALTAKYDLGDPVAKSYTGCYLNMRAGRTY